MLSYLKEILPSLILATLMKAGSVTKNQLKKFGEKLLGKERLTLEKLNLKIAKTEEKLNLKIARTVAKLEGQIAACCALGKKKPSGKVKLKPTKKINKTGSKASKLSKKKPGTRLFPKSVTNAVKKTKRTKMFSLLKKIGEVGVKSIGALAIGVGFAGPLVSVLFSAWFAYDMITTGLIASGVITDDDLTQFEDFVIEQAEKYISQGYNKLINEPLSKKRQHKIQKDRALRLTNNYYEQASDALEKLKKEYEKDPNDDTPQKRRYRSIFATAVKRYTKTLYQSGKYGENIKLFIHRHLEETDFLWHERFRSDKKKADEAAFITKQLELYRNDKKPIYEGDVKGKNVKTSKVRRKNIRVVTEAEKAKQNKTLSTNLKQISGVSLDTYKTDNTFQLGAPVNGLYPPQWKPLENLVPANFRKVIDFIENGNTANYALKGKRSSAYGRYQFMPKTAIEMARKTKDVDEKQWRKPINQDKIFYTLYLQNAKAVNQLAGRGIKFDLMSMWIAHNLGAGAVLWMLTGQGKPVPKSHIDNQLGTKGTTLEESRTLYLQLYREKIAKAINAPIGKESAYGTISGTGTVGKPNSTTSTSKTTKNTVGGGTYTNSSVSGMLPALKVEPWNGEIETNIQMNDVIKLVGGATRSDAWRMLKPEFKTRILQAAAAYKQITGKKLVITSAYRDIKKQTELWNKSNKTGRTVARPGNSMHNWGLAIDLGGSSGVDRGKNNQGDILALNGILDRFKLWRPMSYEPWHIEPIETKGHRGRAASSVQLQTGATSMSSGQLVLTHKNFTAPVYNKNIPGLEKVMSTIQTLSNTVNEITSGRTLIKQPKIGSEVSLNDTIVL